jgi:hypothetical protein
MCFTLGWLEALLVNIIILAAVIAVLRILIPWILGLVGFDPGPLMAIVNIILWAIVAIFVIYLVFSLLSCLGGGGFGNLSLMPHR